MFSEKLLAVFGENARIALCYLFATVFRDVIFRRTRHFPILNLFGEKGTGKTTLATSLQSFFIHGIEFSEARQVLYLNAAAIPPVFSGRGNNVTSARAYWSTIMSYLKSHNSYLGLKQDRFSILLSNGEIDYSVETINGQQVRRKKVNRPKALCFDYLILKDAFGIDLETETIEGDEVKD